MNTSHRLLWIFLGIVVLLIGSVFIYNFYSSNPMFTLGDELIIEDAPNTLSAGYEQRKVDEYLKNNITGIVKMKPALGATNFFIYDETEFYMGNKFIAIFEDGHIQGYLLGKYSTEQSGGIKIVNIAETENKEDLQNLKEKYGFSDIDTSTWKTYRNEKYGFEFKYPSDLIEYNTSYINSSILFQVGFNNLNLEGRNILITVNNKPLDLQLIKNYLDSNVHQINLESKLAYEYTTKTSGPCNSQNVTSDLDGRNLTVSFSGCPLKLSKVAIDQILSTFKFTQ